MLTQSAKISSAILFLTLLTVGCNPGQKESLQTDTTADEQAITAVSAARALAFNESNARGIAEHFTDDAILMAPGKPATVGRDSVRAYYQAIFDAYQPALKSHYEEVAVSGDLAYGRGEATVTLTPKDGGAPVTSTAKYLNILQKQPDGSWKTTHDVWNSNAPEQ